MLLQSDGESRELVTPPLDGTILPGVTRDSILQLCKSWGEFTVSERQLTIKEIKQVIAKMSVQVFICILVICVVIKPEYQSMRYAMQ